MGNSVISNSDSQETGPATGGNATASGMQFQSHIAAAIAASLIAESPLDSRLGLGDAKARIFRLETEALVDDVLT